MTKTFDSIDLDRVDKHGLRAMMPYGTNATEPLFGILNLIHLILFEIWILVLGISLIQRIFIKQVDHMIKSWL